MTAELKPTFAIKYENGYLKDNVLSETLNINCNTVTPLLISDVYTVSNSASNVNTSLLTTLGYCYMKNVTVSNDFLQYGPISGANFNIMGRLASGESAMFRLEPGITLRWVGNTNTVRVLLKIYNA